MIRLFIHFLRRSIARKLTLTLVGFVALTTVAAGLYLTRALEIFERLGTLVEPDKIKADLAEARR